MSFEASTKSAEAFRTISEVAVELNLPQHVLRFWEGRFPQVHPMKRAGGRRYYRPEDVDLLRGIHKLLYGEGLTIRGVQKILREQGPRYVTQLGRGEVQFMTPLNRRRPRPVADAEYALHELAALQLEFSEPAEHAGALEAAEEELTVEAIEAVEPIRVRIDEMTGLPLDELPEESAEAAAGEAEPVPDLGPNVHAFPRQVQRKFTHEQRARLHELLRDMLDMKMQLRSAKANCRAIAGLL